MPVVPASTVRQQVAQRKPDPVYLIVGDDEADMSRLSAEISSLIEDELRAFNSERFYAGERGVTPAAIAGVRCRYRWAVRPGAGRASGTRSDRCGRTKW